MHDKLEVLFGIITISSEPLCKVVEKNMDVPIVIEDSDDDQEVNSPLDSGRKPSRRILYDSPVSHEKVTMLRLQLYNRPKFPISGYCPMKPKFGKIDEIEHNKDSSSYASSSPLKWFLSPSAKN